MFTSTIVHGNTQYQFDEHIVIVYQILCTCTYSLCKSQFALYITFEIVCKYCDIIIIIIKSNNYEREHLLVMFHGFRYSIRVRDHVTEES